MLVSFLYTQHTLTNGGNKLHRNQEERFFNMFEHNLFSQFTQNRNVNDQKEWQLWT